MTTTARALVTILVFALVISSTANAIVEPSPVKVWTSENDGRGSGLDADLLAGYNGYVLVQMVLRHDASIGNGTPLAQERAERIANDSALRDGLTAEELARIAADEDLAADITDELRLRAEADELIRDDLNAEAAARVSADDAERAERNTNVTSLQGQIDALRGDVEDETAGRIATDAAHSLTDDGLARALANESSLRRDEDEQLAIRIDVLEARIADLTDRIEALESPGTLSWRLLHAEDFDNGTSSWSHPDAFYDCFGNTMAGGGGVSSRALSRTFDLSGSPHAQVYVKFTFAFLASWDGESARLEVNGQQVWTDSFQYGPTGLCGQNTKVVTTAATIPDNANSLVVRFVAATDQSPHDESFAIDDIEVWVL